MTHYTDTFNSAIPELATSQAVWNKNVFKERLKAGVERINLSFVGRRFHAPGQQQKTPSRRISDGSWE